MWSVNSLRSPAAVPAALLTMTALVGCSAPPSSFTTPNADVTIAGQRFESVPVSCRQYGWSWTIESMQHEPGFTAVIGTGNAVTAQMAQFRNLGGFSGTFGQGDTGDGQAKFEDDDFVMSGTAVGGMHNQSKQLMPRSFTVRAHC